MIQETTITSPWSDLADRVLNGNVPTFEEAYAVLEAPDTELLNLLAAAYRVRYHHFGNTVKLNYLLNAKSGLCPEDCHYCSQSRVSNAPIERYPLLTEDDIIAQASHAIASQATTCCIVTSARHPTPHELGVIANAVRKIKAQTPHLKICVSLGLLQEQDAQLLKDAGVDRYNHNLNTAESHYSEICTTHTYADRVKTVTAAQRAGLSPCSGIIVGMGESYRQIVEVSYHLRQIGAESIPINALLRIPGTPLEDHGAALSPRFCLKVLCMFRFVCADRELRVSAGREVHFRSLQPLSLYPANALFVGDYLTTEGQTAPMDWQMIEDLGFTIERIEEPAHERETAH